MRHLYRSSTVTPYKTDNTAGYKGLYTLTYTAIMLSVGYLLIVVATV